MGIVVSTCNMTSTKGAILLFFVLPFISASFNAFEGAERRRWLPIKSCTSQSSYDGYSCWKAYNGVIKSGKDGWSHKGKAPQWVEFTLRDVSKVNRVAIKSLWPDKMWTPKNIKVELLKDGKWIVPQKQTLGHGASDFNGEILTVKEKMEEVDVAFPSEEKVSKVRITNTGAFYSSVVFSEVLIQYVPEKKGCRTVGGTQRNRECIFPFVNPWTNAVHYGCTSDYGLPPWCATRVNSDLTMSDHRFSGFCNASCEVEPHNYCYTMWSHTKKEIYLTQKTRERRSCIFPFELRGKWYNECVHWGARNIQYCATSTLPNGTMIDLGYCGPECPGSKTASQCVTAGGYRKGKGRRCVFPYYHKKKYYSTCAQGIFDKNTKPMCATAINYNTFEPLSDQWGYCSEEEKCNKDECITVGGAHVGQTCKFPFRNKWSKEIHWGCTTASLEQDVGNNMAYASAPWCATETAVDDEMVDGKWGFCSSKCSLEKGTNCYVDDGTEIKDTKKCIFPFIYNGLVNKQCTYVQGYLKCPIAVDKNGFAEEKDMRRCGPSETCFNRTTINGNAITIGWQDVGSYANDGSKALQVSFSFETGVEDTSESNWNVEASVTAGFEAYKVSWEASVTAGGGGGSSYSSSNHQSHSLTYKVPPHTRVVLSQQILSSGVFKSRSFKLILTEYKLGSERKAEPVVRELDWKKISPQVTSRNLN